MPKVVIQMADRSFRNVYYKSPIPTQIVYFINQEKFPQLLSVKVALDEVPALSKH